jgi:hypothetical protein
LQSLLNIMQMWIKRLKYHPKRGFYHARDASGNRYLMLDSQIPSNIPARTDSLLEALGHYDHAFEQRWFRSSYMDPIWTAPLPHGHSKAPPVHHTPAQPVYGQDPYAAREEDSKRAKIGVKKVQKPDFINTSPPMLCVDDMPHNRTVLQNLYGKFNAGVQFPRLQAANGTFQTLCLNSSFASPHNSCRTCLCGDRKSTPRTPRLHIDLALSQWTTKPEVYWAPMVAFLQSPTVASHVRPTTALKQLTPNANWT